MPVNTFKKKAMKIKIFILSLIVLGAISITAQEPNMNNQKSENPPYHQIPDAPEDYDNVNVAARMIDGLGYRYYWSTKDLRAEDLAYRPSEDSRTSGETLEHIYSLSKTIKNGISSTPNIRPEPKEDLTFEEKRRKTLENFETASNYLKSSKRKSMKNMKIIFERGEKSSEFPFWNVLNGPLADAIYHTGQIVAYRRASGNPQFKGVSVFKGKTKE